MKSGNEVVQFKSKKADWLAGQVIEGGIESITLILYEHTLVFPEMSVTLKEIKGSVPILNSVPAVGDCVMVRLGSQLSRTDM